MGWLLIIFIAGIIGTCTGYVMIHYTNRTNWRSYVPYTLTWMAAVAIGSAIVGGIIGDAESGNISHADQSCTEEVVKIPIISTVRERATSGSFVLGTGGIKSIDRYYVYIEREHGMKLTTFSVNDTYIKEGDWEPYYGRTDYFCERTFRNWFWFGTRGPKRNYGDFGVLYVPTGTVLREFKL